MLFEYGYVRAVQTLFRSHIVQAEFKIECLIFTSFLVDVYTSELSELLKKHAPLRTKIIKLSFCVLIVPCILINYTTLNTNGEN